jgi:outer membrane protein assembly factor BamB
MVPWCNPDNPAGKAAGRPPAPAARLPWCTLVGLGLLSLLLASCATSPPDGSRQPAPTSTLPAAAANATPIYVASYGSPLGQDGDSWLYALDRENGKPLWRYQFPPGTLQVAEPEMAGGSIYLAATSVTLGSNGQPTSEPVSVIYALRARDGKPLWHYRTTGQDTAPVTVFNETVYLETSIDPAGTANGAIYALRAGDGSLLWRRPTDGDGLGVPAVSATGVYLVTRLVLGTSQIVTALRPADGGLIWQQSGGLSLSSGATLAGGVLYIGGDQAAYALDAGNGSILWQRQVPDQIDLAPVVQGATLYLQSLEDPSVEALNLSDGSSRWRILIRAEENIAPLVATATTLYVPLSRVVVAVRAGDGTILARYTTDETNVGVALTGNLLLIGVADSLEALETSDGSLRWHTTLPGYNVVPPVVGS